MATDSELVELAGKAIGLEVVHDNFGGHHVRSFAHQHESYKTHPWAPWNPLADDGDALRLAVKLDLVIERYDGNSTIAGNVLLEQWPHEPDGNDPAASTRRAIVRAAAEIGRAMP